MTQTIADLINDMQDLRAGLADGTARNAAGEPATGDVEAAITALDGAIALLSGGEAVEAAAAPEPELPPYAIVDAKPGAPDDLRNIRGISSATAYALTNLGITRYAHIAGLTARDVRQLKTDLGYRCTIGRDNWIEQAAMLEGGQSTSFSRRGGPATLGASIADAPPLETANVDPGVSAKIPTNADFEHVDTVSAENEPEIPIDEPPGLIALNGLDTDVGDMSRDTVASLEIEETDLQNVEEADVPALVSEEDAAFSEVREPHVPAPEPDQEVVAADHPIEVVEEPDVDPQKEAGDLDTDDRAIDDNAPAMNGESAAMAAGLGTLIAGGLAHGETTAEADEASEPPAEMSSVAPVIDEDTSTHDVLFDEDDAATPGSALELNDHDDVFAQLPEPVAVLPSLTTSASASVPPPQEHAPIENTAPASAVSEPNVAAQVIKTEDHPTEPTAAANTIATPEPSEAQSPESLVPAATGLGALLAAVEPTPEAHPTPPPPDSEDSAAPFAPVIQDTSVPPALGATDTSTVSIRLSDEPAFSPDDTDAPGDNATAADLMEMPEDGVPSDLRSELEAQFAPIIQASGATHDAPSQIDHSPEMLSPPRPAMADRLGASRATIDPLPEPFSPHKTAVDEAEIVIVRDGKSDAPVPHVPELTDRDSNTGLVGRISRMFARKS